MNLVKEINQLARDTKRVRAEAIATLRELDNETLAKLEPKSVDGFGYNRFVKKVRNYPSDLTLPRLAAALTALEQLK